MKMLRSRLYDKMEQERSAAIAADRKSQVGIRVTEANVSEHIIFRRAE